ncbi:lysine transporter LysE [Flavobacteriaceae bacterium F08102]|nr:lysine transporter LysE [Flavobacteriaceae bacterium F08102]
MQITFQLACQKIILVCTFEPNMTYLTHLFYGFILAFGGLLIPGMINMTAVKVTIEKGKRKGLIFSSGAALIVFVQASIAVFFAQYLNKHPDIIANLKIVGVVIFSMLAIYFFYQARYPKEIKVKQYKGGDFFIGMFLSSINMLSIPFYLAMATYLNAKGHLNLNNTHMTFFALGTLVGAGLLLFVYVNLAGLITKKAQFIAKNINFILGCLFVVLASLVTLQLYNFQ